MKTNALTLWAMEIFKKQICSVFLANSCDLHSWTLNVVINSYRIHLGAMPSNVRVPDKKNRVNHLPSKSFCLNKVMSNKEATRLKTANIFSCYSERQELFIYQDNLLLLITTPSELPIVKKREVHQLFLLIKMNIIAVKWTKKFCATRIPIEIYNLKE